MGVCSSLQRPSPRSEWRRPGLTFQEERPPGMSAKSVTLLPRSIWRGTGFEPSTSWSRTSLDQTKSVELTAFACAFPPLIWTTWATKYRWPQFGMFTPQFGMFTLADLPVASRLRRDGAQFPRPTLRPRKQPQCPRPRGARAAAKLRKAAANHGADRFL